MVALIAGTYYVRVGGGGRNRFRVLSEQARIAASRQHTESQRGKEGCDFVCVCVVGLPVSCQIAASPCLKLSRRCRDTDANIRSTWTYTETSRRLSEHLRSIPGNSLRHHALDDREGRPDPPLEGQN